MSRIMENPNMIHNTLTMYTKQAISGTQLHCMCNLYGTSISVTTYSATAAVAIAIPQAPLPLKPLPHKLTS